MLVQLDRVMKKYGSFALELNMEIPENQVTGLIGANGAGKSTTFKLMLGLIRPDEGNVEIFGRNAAEMGAEDKQKIGENDVADFIQCYKDKVVFIKKIHIKMPPLIKMRVQEKLHDNSF